VPGDDRADDRQRDQPPQDRRQERQHGEGEQGGRRVEDVPGRELVAAGQLFRIEVRAAAQPALRRANVDLAVRSGRPELGLAEASSGEDEQAVGHEQGREADRQRAIPFDEALP
jgi:hypothetical protein